VRGKEGERERERLQEKKARTLLSHPSVQLERLRLVLVRVEMERGRRLFNHCVGSLNPADLSLSLSYPSFLSSFSFFYSISV